MTATEAAGRGQVTLRQVLARGRVRAMAGLLGPAFVASVAYVDPGNFATNFAGGAQHGYELASVIAMADLMAILVQYLTSKTGLATGRTLPELCRERFGRRVNVLLWLQAEVRRHGHRSRRVRRRRDRDQPHLRCPACWRPADA